MRLFASPDDRALVDGSVPDGLVVAFGDAAASTEPVLRFAPSRGSADDLLIHPDPDLDVWRCAPWPAADDLFVVPPPPAGSPVLVIHPQRDRRERMVRTLRDHAVPCEPVGRLRRPDLERAGTILFLEEDVFPPVAPAACAASRLVLLPSTARHFGLQDGIDCLVFSSTGDVIVFTQVATGDPAAFQSLRAMARLAARPYRASEVYARLALDVSLGVGASRDALTGPRAD